MPFNARLLVSEPNMANCLDRLLYESITSESQNDSKPGSLDQLVNLIQCGNLNPNYVFTSQYSVAKRIAGKPLLYLAVICDRADVVSLLLNHDNGASPNCSRQPYAFESANEDPFKRTAIFQSLCESSVDVFNMLLNAPIPCDALAVDSLKCSLLWHAVNMAQIVKVDALMKSVYGPKLVNLPDRCGLPPLHVAAINNCTAAAELLLSGGAIVDATQREGATALCIASKRGAVNVIKILLRHGANPNYLHSGENASKTFDIVNKEKSKTVAEEQITPVALCLQPTRPFGKSPEQISEALATLVLCGARLPSSVTLPSYLPASLISLCNSPATLQVQSALVIRDHLVTKVQGRSIKSLVGKLTDSLPKSLVDFIIFDFLR